LIGVDVLGLFVVAADPEAPATEALAMVALAAMASVSDGRLVMELPL
jgi:hypothetical protein